jgi:hypothetical protein
MLQLLERRLVDARRRLPGGEPLEHRPNRIQLHELLDRYLAHDRTAKRRADNEPEQVEIPQRFADRSLTDTELLGDSHLDDALPWSNPAVQDVLD